MTEIASLETLDPVAVLVLNNASARETSMLDGPGLSALLAGACYSRGVAPAQAMLIAFEQDADYDSPNFRWFADRLERFVYIDRVVIAAAARGGGLGRALYADLAAWACAAGHARIVCEVNTDPDNPPSHALHARLGFRPAGEMRHGPEKAVRFYELAL